MEMKIRNILSVLPAFAMLCACQSEAPQVDTTTKRVITVRAFLPDSDNTRTHITYGNQDSIQEFFRWHPVGAIKDTEDDYITIFNVSKLSQYNKVELNVVKINGNSAEFESTDTIDKDDFYVYKNDILFVNYWFADGKIDETGRNIFEIDNTDFYPQPIVDNPFDDNYMTYMQKSLKMYDIVTVKEDGKIPDIHFKHLSSILRVTLRNETGENIYPKSLKFECQEESPIFISKLCCGVSTEAADSASLIIYDESEYSNSVTYFTNNYTAADDAAVGGAVAPGETYNLYVPFIPRINDNIKAEKLIITLEARDNSSESGYYSITLEQFDVVLRAGLRYWFNLTAVSNGDNKELMLTNKWEEQHPAKNPNNGEETPSGDE